MAGRSTTAEQSAQHSTVPARLKRTQIGGKMSPDSWRNQRSVAVSGRWFHHGTRTTLPFPHLCLKTCERSAGCQLPSLKMLPVAKALHRCGIKHCGDHGCLDKQPCRHAFIVSNSSSAANVSKARTTHPPPPRTRCQRSGVPPCTAIGAGVH